MSDNPFVKTALRIIETHNHQPPALVDLVTELAAVEPMLSPFNLECVAREALSAEAAEQARVAAKAAAEAAWRAAQAAATDAERWAAEVPEEPATYERGNEFGNGIRADTESPAAAAA